MNSPEPVYFDGDSIIALRMDVKPQALMGFGKLSTSTLHFTPAKQCNPFSGVMRERIKTVIVVLRRWRGNVTSEAPDHDHQ